MTTRGDIFFPNTSDIRCSHCSRTISVLQTTCYGCSGAPIHSSCKECPHQKKTTVHKIVIFAVTQSADAWEKENAEAILDKHFNAKTYTGKPITISEFKIDDHVILN